jgi:hypothetical protein
MSLLKVNNIEDLGADNVITNGVIEKSALPAGSNFAGCVCDQNGYLYNNE